MEPMIVFSGRAEITLIKVNFMSKIILVVLISLLPTIVHAINLICELEYASEITSVIPIASFDPYEKSRADLGGNFRFYAQYLRGSNKLKTFVYHDAKARYVLIHAAEYRVEETDCKRYEHGFGLNKIYSADLERELLFQCRSICR